MDSNFYCSHLHWNWKMNGVGTPRCNPTTGANCTLAPKSSIPREAQIDELWIVKDAKKDPVLGAHGTITCLLKTNLNK